MRRAPAPSLLAALLAVGLLAGCGDEEPTTSPTIGSASAEPTGQSSASASAGSEESGVPAPEPPVASGRKAPQHSVKAYPGTPFPTSGDDKRVADTLVAYMDARLRSYHVAGNVPELAGLAIGKALSTAQVRAQELRQAGLHDDGNVWLGVRDVSVKKGKADVTGCMWNSSVDVDAKHIAREQAPAAYDLTATARSTGPRTWLIETIEFQPVAGC